MIDPRWLKAIEDELSTLAQQEANLCLAAIVKHIPLKAETAYMEVPRCDLCDYWTTSPIRAGAESFY